MRRLLIAPAFFVITILFIAGASESIAKDQAALEKRLAYLTEISEVSWVEFDRNNVYIGFKERPADLRAIINAAAIWGNRAYGFGVHVWAVEARYRGWRPGDGPYYCEATARHGKIENNSCR